MAQHDYNLANQAGAAFRSDLNDALAAIVTLNSGASAPSTTFARMLWADTTSGLLKQRNAANADWLVRGTLAETFVLARSSDTILGVSDRGRVIVATSTFTQTLTAAATLGDGWFVGYRNDGSGVITFDPNSTETIDGATTITLQPGEACVIHCNGSAFKTIGRRRINDLVEDTAPVAADDFVETWDASAGAHKKVRLSSAVFGAMVLLDEQVASNSPQLDFTTGLDGTYDLYEFQIIGLRPATDATILYTRISEDGGSTFKSGAADYVFTGSGHRNDDVATSSASTGAPQIQWHASGSPIGNNSVRGLSSTIRLYEPADTTQRKAFVHETGYITSGGITVSIRGTAYYIGSVNPIDGVRFFMNSGNIAEGVIRLYGIKKG